MAAQEIDNSTTWGKELWDQFDNIATHTQKGIDFIERFGGFIRDRSAIEVEYALKLRRLVKNYQPKKSKEDEENEFSSLIAFKNVLKEVADLAGQREVVAENLQNQVLQGILLLAKNLREERKKALNQGASLTQSLHTQIGTLDRAKRSYEKAFREAEKAIESYHKADADFHLSRADVEKQRVNMNIRNSQSEDAKSEYANQLQITNKQQQQHYQIALPEVFNRLQELDEKRTRGMKEFIKRSADVEYEVSPIIAHCLEGIVKAADSINEKDDSMIVIEKYQSGFQPPGDIPFEDLSKPDPDAANNSQTHNSSTGLNHMTGKGTTKDKLKKRVGIFGIFTGNKSRRILEACINVKNNLSTDGLKEDFSDLPPTQRRKKLTAKVQELQQKVAQEQAASDGLMKMKGVYEANSMLGDPRTVEEQLNESVNRLDRLRHELLRYQKLLEQANNQSFIQHSPQSNRVIQNGQRSSRHSNGSSNHENSHEDNGEDHPDDAGSLSRSASESSVQQAQNGLNINNNGSSASPESGLGTSHTSLPGSGQGSTNEQPMNEEFYEADTPLGTCRALYPFDATSEGSIPMSEGEELQVIEVDQGDGWTRVRRFSSKGWEEGFVPTSYIECTLYA
ncbi:formin-binding protein 1-like isoform X7 [Anopheles merus]|uniref:formin-binding protein 1-like isoform X7 n=1 Tax=Anopheles merus TaxID=30066 RepID=UPI001BE473A6|nr:formin-binding protein 1-like isoform X7 [Anopheles merus]